MIVLIRLAIQVWSVSWTDWLRWFCRSAVAALAWRNVNDMEVTNVEDLKLSRSGRKLQPCREVCGDGCAETCDERGCAGHRGNEEAKVDGAEESRGLTERYQSKHVSSHVVTMV